MKRITESDLDALAQSHGFKDFQEMSDNLDSCADKESLAIDLIRIENLIKEPVTNEEANLPPRNGLADVQVDATGLPDLHDLVQTVSRLIVKLLIGYDADEIQFLRDRAYDIEAKHVHETHHRTRKGSGFGGLSHA